MNCLGNTSTMRRVAMLLLMLLTVSTTWAQESEEPVTEPGTIKATAADIGKVISTDGCIYASESDVHYGEGEKAVAMIAYVDEENHKGLAIALNNVYDGNTYKSSFQWDEAAAAVQTWPEGRAVAGGTWKVPTIQEWQQMLIGCGANGSVSDSPESGTFTFTGINEKLANLSDSYKLSSGYWSATDYPYSDNSAWEIYFDVTNNNTCASFWGYEKVSSDPIRACLAFETSGGESGGETVTTNTYVSTFTGIDNILYLTSAENNNWVVSDTDCGIGFTKFNNEPCIIFDTPSTDNVTVTVLTPAFEISGEVSSITIKAAAGINSIVLNDNDNLAFTKNANEPFDEYTLTLTPQSGVSVNSIKITGKSSSFYLHSITIETTSSGGGEGGESGNVINSNTASINMPVSDVVEYTIAQDVTSFNIYDDGGAEGNYSDGCDGTVVLTAPIGCKLMLTGSVTSDSYDYLKVWDGTSDEAEPAIEVSGTVTLNTFTSAGESIRINFYSDSGINDEGLNLTVTVIDPNNKHAINIESVQGGHAYLYLDPAESAAGEDININFSPNQGYMTESISVVDANSNPVSVTGGKWYNNPSYAYFTMPNAAVTVTPTFTNAKTAAQGLYVNMPADYSTTWASIPEGVQSFKLYDDGGQNNTYSKGTNSTIVLTAPENYLLQLTGTITALAYETLTVKDGQYNNDAPQLKTAKSSSNGETTDIGTISSTGRYMRISFQTYSNENDYSGLDLTVTLINPNTESDIAITPASNGSVVAKVGGSEVTKANVGDVVTISATPNKDYVLAGITVTDAYSNPVSVTGGTWYNNTATFTMPATAVTVTPVFEVVSSFEPYINMPKSGTLTATIPAAVSSFKVYDDGGENSAYSSNSNGMIVLKAPEGCMLHLKGSVKGNPDAKLTVWDGTDTTEDNAKLIDGAYSEANKEKLVGGVVSSGQDMTLQFVTGYNLSSFEGLNLNVTRVDVCLDNIGNNSESISQNAGRQGLNVALKNRTLYKDGKWNTLCLPFDVTLSGSPLEGATARSLTTAKIEGSTLDLTFGDAVTELVAGTPYIIKWANGSDIVSPVLFEGVTVSTDKHDYDTDGDNTTTDERVRFVGTYESSVFSAEDNSILLVGGSNTLFYPNERTGLGAQRAYFKIGADGALQARRLTSFNFNEGQNGTTGILTVGTKMEKAGEPDTWYTLDGMKLQGKPTKKGLYTINGKKFVIK